MDVPSFGFRSRFVLDPFSSHSLNMVLFLQILSMMGYMKPNSRAFELLFLFSIPRIASSQRPLPDNTQHSQQTNIHAPGGIRTNNLSRRAAANLHALDRAATGTGHEFD